MPGRSSRRVRHVSVAQLVTLLLAFLMLAMLAGVIGSGLAIPAAGSAGTIAKAVPAVINDLPADMEVVEPSEESQMLDSEGHVIARFYSERRIVVDSDQISTTMKNAMVAVEDRRFFQHHGADATGLMRAAVSNASGNETQGASTITQQYVRNMLVEKGLQEGDQDLIDKATEATPQRKLREIRYAMSLEQQLSKDQILTGYLNIAPFGPQTYGVEAAARQYFSKSALDLSVSESALLAGLVQSPVSYNPLTNPKAAQTRRDTVLRLMRSQGKISDAQYRKAKAQDVKSMLHPESRTQGCNGAGESGYFCNYVYQELMQDKALGKTQAERIRRLQTGGLTIRTTLNSSMQSAAYKAAVWRVPKNDPSGVNSAIISVEPKTGKILAMAQNTTFGTPTKTDSSATETSYTVDRAHGGGTGFQPGSSFKLFTLLEWFREGHSAAERVGGSQRTFLPSEFHCASGHVATLEPWEVGDVEGKAGSYDVQTATHLSVNEAFADMATRIDLCQIFQRAADLGVTEPDGSVITAYPPNIIGASNVPPLAMASAYSALANNGVRCTPTSLEEIEDRDGNVIQKKQPSCKRGVAAKVANQVSTVLQRSAYGNKGSGGYISSVQIGRPFGAKSGTSDNSTSTWLIGYTPQIATAAWVGTGQSSSRSLADVVINGVRYTGKNELYGETFVGPMWGMYMRAAVKGTPVEQLATADVGEAASSASSSSGSGTASASPSPTTSTRNGSTTTGGTNRNTSQNQGSGNEGGNRNHSGRGNGHG